jgi:hypothetical protein
MSNKKSEANKKRPPRWATNKKLRRHLGDVVQMTINRYRVKFPNFPRPVKVDRVELTDLNEVDDWLIEQAKNRAAQ